MKTFDEIIEKDILISDYLDTFKLVNDELDYKNIKNEDVLFFDIETTGLNVSKTNLYLIGYVYFKDSKWHYCQLFGETIKDEKLILESFKDICRKYKYLIHFNGNHFDVPYINQKCLDHGIELYLNNLISLDIYLLVKQFKKHLGLPNCKQKTIEDLIGITREDKFNGGELIPQYYEYMKTKDKVLEKNLLLHNAEDCIGMLKILDIMDYIKLVEFLSTGDYEVSINLEKSKDLISFSLVPHTASKLNEIYLNEFNLRNYNIKIANNEILLKGKLYDGILKHYFEDYQNYYYVKETDTAIHKSVAKYLKPDEREKAKAATCYLKKEGIFIPIFGEIKDDLIFKTDNKDTNNYILFISEDCIKDVNDIEVYLKNSLINLSN